MANKTVAAEITPTPGRAQSAAKALQQLGFRVLHIGHTISVQAPEQLWGEVFDVSFHTETQRRVAASPKSATEYAVPDSDSVQIPATLGELITEVSFARPPEFF